MDKIQAGTDGLKSKLDHEKEKLKEYSRVLGEMEGKCVAQRIASCSFA